MRKRSSAPTVVAWDSARVLVLGPKVRATNVDRGRVRHYTGTRWLDAVGLDLRRGFSLHFSTGTLESCMTTCLWARRPTSASAQDSCEPALSVFLLKR